MGKKHIITAGCSFTNCGNSWPYYLDREKYEVHNIATPGAGQAYISRSTIYHINKLLNEGIERDRIKVLVMWSGMDRHEVLSTDRETPMHQIYIDGNDMNWLENFVCTEKHYRIPYKESCWLKSSTRGMQWENKPVVKLFDNYFKNFYTEEESFLRGLENILRLQWFLEKENISHKFMTWQNSFNKYSFTVPSGFGEVGQTKIGHDIWCMGWTYQKWHDNIIWPKEIDCKLSKDSPLLKDIYHNTTHLWDIMDWDKWWFYEDEQVEYGGLAEWIILGERFAWGNGKHDPGHPHPDSNKLFVEKVINPMIEVL